jgi:hypothetical protein
MAEAAVIVNVNSESFLSSMGLSGQHMIPGKLPNEEFGMLVLYPTPEIQDIGDGRRTTHWVKARPLAQSICGFGSEYNLTAQGVALLDMEPDIPKSLEKAIEAEVTYLNANRPEVKYKMQAGAMVAVNVFEPGVAEQLIKNSTLVVRERVKFEADLRKQVPKELIAKAKVELTTYAQKKVAEGDIMWARPSEHQNISDVHRRCCRFLGQERPWCYTPQQLEDCPGCGKMNKVGVIRCGSCEAILDRPREDYAKMSNKEKALALYPWMYAENEAPVAARK